jgi:hypothetical protein
MPLTPMRHSQTPSNSDNQSTPTDGATQQPIVAEQTVEQPIDEQTVDELIDDDDYDYDLPTDRNQRLMAVDPYGEHEYFYLFWERDIAAQTKRFEDARRWIASLTPEELAQEFPPF